MVRCAHGRNLMTPWILGHRGASGHAPENTLEALLLAGVQGADGVEYDVQLSSDGHPVVFHDTELVRTTGASGAVRDRSLADLEHLSAGIRHARSCRIPRLDPVLERVGGIHNLEIKLPDGPFENPHRQALASASLRSFSRAWRSGRIAAVSTITSFDLPTLDLVCRLDPAVRFGPIVEDDAGWEALRTWNPPRPPAVLSLAADLAPRLLRSGSSRPRSVRECRVWLWHVPEHEPWRTLPWHPEALVVNDPAGVRGRLETARRSP